MKAIQLPEFINTFVGGRQLLIRTTSPHYVAEVVSYHSAEEMYHAVALLHTEHIPYITLTKRNIAIIFAGAMGRVPLIPSLMAQVNEAIRHMADDYLKEHQV